MLRGVRDALANGTRRTVFYANSYAVTLAEVDPTFAHAMSQADTIFCDGFGVYVASRALGAGVPERFAWPDWIDQLAMTCRDAGAAIFFLGAADGVAQKAAAKLQMRVPGLQTYAHHGHFAKDEVTSQTIIDLVNRSGASVLFVGFGMPLQETWITKHRHALHPVIVFSVGAMFDYIAGSVRRGPRWLTQHGFEWLTRLVIEPRRLWRRYLLGLPEFAALVARQWISTSRRTLHADSGGHS
jgi:N-acetylglucosaminyldiphosphoundecaprenol N-acetyl-beta-D-mannosaminyltransferase